MEFWLEFMFGSGNLTSSENKENIMCMQWIFAVSLHFKTVNKMLAFSYHNISILPHNLSMEVIIRVI